MGMKSTLSFAFQITNSQMLVWVELSIVGVFLLEKRASGVYTC
jgi:hypothetical protein